MDVSSDAQVLPAAGNHSAFNTVNARGPRLGGLAIAAKWGWTSIGSIGMGLALGEMAIQPRTTRFAAALIAFGRYGSVSEIVRAAMRGLAW